MTRDRRELAALHFLWTIAVCGLVVLVLSSMGCGSVVLGEADAGSTLVSAAPTWVKLEAGAAVEVGPEAQPAGTGPDAADDRGSSPETHGTVDGGAPVIPGCVPSGLYPDPVRGLVPCP